MPYLHETRRALIVRKSAQDAHSLTIKYPEYSGGIAGVTDYIAQYVQPIGRPAIVKQISLYEFPSKLRSRYLTHAEVGIEAVKGFKCF